MGEVWCYSIRLRHFVVVECARCEPHGRNLSLDEVIDVIAACRSTMPHNTGPDVVKKSDLIRHLREAFR
jgi:hypothetical protein